MLNLTKPFNQLLHDAVDPISRKRVADWVFMNWDLDAEDNPNKYGVDLIAKRNGQKVGYIEVEMRDWGFDLCPYPTIHVAKRKEKLFNNDLKTLIFVVTRDLSHAYWCNVEKVKASPVREIPNKAVRENEYFYDVPINSFNLVDLNRLF